MGSRNLCLFLNGFFINFHLFLQHHLTVFKAYYEAMGYLEFEISNNCTSAFGSKELCKIVQNIVAPIKHVQNKNCIRGLFKYECK